MPKTNISSAHTESTSPDYIGLVKFLVQPFLEVPESLKIDCEQFNQNQRVWIRLAFEGTDKGRVYGRGGRNIQAIRTVLEIAATIAGQSLYLDIYESPDDSLKRREQENNGRDGKPDRKKHRPHRSEPPPSPTKSRPQPN
jgi:predicted RNA-binding protein YlqC (UPF0109 family)